MLHINSRIACCVTFNICQNFYNAFKAKTVLVINFLKRVENYCKL